MFLSVEFLDLSRDTISLSAAWVPIMTAALGAIGSGLKAIEGNKMKKDAKDAIDNYKRQNLENAYKGIEYYNNKGRGYADKMIQQNLGTAASTAQQMGGRYTGLAASENNANNAILAQAKEEQQAFIDHANRVAADDVNIRNTRENRDIANLNALGKIYNAGEQNMWSGITEGVTNIGLGLGAADEGGLFDKKEE